MQRLYGCQPRAMGASGDHWFVPWGWYSSSNSRVSGVPSAPTCCRCEVLSAPDKDSQPGLHSTAQSVHRCCSAAAAAKALNSGSGRGVEVVMERCLGFHGLSGRFGGGLPVENILLFHEPGNGTVVFTTDWTSRSAMVLPRLVGWQACPCQSSGSGQPAAWRPSRQSNALSAQATTLVHSPTCM